MQLFIFITFLYASILNVFVFRVYLQHSHDTPRAPPEPVTMGLTLLSPSQPVAAQPFDPTCADPTLVLVVVLGAAQTSTASPFPLLNRLRELLSPQGMRVVLTGQTETPAAKLWCSSIHTPCSLAHNSLDLHLDPQAVLTALAPTLLAHQPCIDDIVLLSHSLRIDHVFLHQLQRLTRAGKVACLAADSQFALQECPALAFRLPRAFLWQFSQDPAPKASVLADAAARGMLGNSVQIVRVL